MIKKQVIASNINKGSNSIICGSINMGIINDGICIGLSAEDTKKLYAIFGNKTNLKKNEMAFLRTFLSDKANIQNLHKYMKVYLLNLKMKIIG